MTGCLPVLSDVSLFLELLVFELAEDEAEGGACT